VVEKSGKSASYIYVRLLLLQLIARAAEAFTQESITAGDANLIAHQLQESRAKAFEHCSPKDWQDREPRLLPAKLVSASIPSNLYLALANPPFDREAPPLNPSAGACLTSSGRSGHNTSLFVAYRATSLRDRSSDQAKVDAHVGASPKLVQISMA
jgi:ParB family chromosome partitioning protein